ncbi:MAG: Gfo/Idh/MocA family oxidoreductase [Thermotogae bacterium]|nr:Gfo/Idh/MocA family oxidoreductase [Thermotogota bacterium]
MIKMGLIGCGRIASKKHTEAVIKNSDIVELTAVCDIVKENAEKLADIIEKSGLKRPLVYTDYNEMTEKEHFDFVTIATESGKHHDISMDVMKKNINVLTEKPMALSTKDMDEMIDFSEKNGLNLGVCFQNRFNPPVQELRKKIENGDFGKLFHGQISIRWNRNIDYYKQAPWRGTWSMDGGTLMNQCTHGIDLLIWTFGGEIEEISGKIANFNHPYNEAEDFGSAVVKFKNGCIGIIEGTADVYPKNLNETLSVFGENGSVVIGGLAVNKIETWNFQNESGHPFQNLPDPETVYGEGHVPLYKDFISSLNENRKPLVDGREGKKAVQAVLAIYKSSEENKIIKFPFDFSTDEMKYYL